MNKAVRWRLKLINAFLKADELANFGDPNAAGLAMLREARQRSKELLDLLDRRIDKLEFKLKRL